MKKKRTLGQLRQRSRALLPEKGGEPLYADIASQVAEQRIARDISQSELSELCGTTQSAIARLERGKRPPRIDTLQRIANALDCELVIELKPRTKVKNVEPGKEGDRYERYK